MTRLLVLGCSDAFSSGGRLFPAFLVQSASSVFLLDCGPTTVTALKRLGIDADTLDAVLLSHFHGDHFGGLPFLELELGLLRHRSRPLAVAGPPGVAECVRSLVDAMYPALPPKQRLAYEFIEWDTGAPVSIGALRVGTAAVVHTPESKPHALRVEIDGRVIAYSGDTEWTDALIDIAAGADLFICEATTHSLRVENHLSYETLMAHAHRLTCKRLLITHMSDGMLARLPVEGAVAAEDGLVVEL